MITAKRGKISAFQLFCILTVSRVSVSLTYLKNISKGEFAADTLLSLFIAFFLTLVFALPSYYCSIKRKNPLETGLFGVVYSILFAYYAAANISRFAYFSLSRGQQEGSSVFVILLVSIAACCCAVLGIEGIGRFSLFCAGALFVVLCIGVLANINSFDIINLYPLQKNSKQVVFENALLYASNSVEPLIVLALDKRINANKAKPLFWGITVSYALISVVIFVCLGVFGFAASLYPYPVYNLYRTAVLGNGARLDVIHTAFWAFSLFMKSSLFIYCSSVQIKRFSHGAKCLVLSAFAGVAAAVLNYATLFTSLTEKGEEISIALCAVFVLFIPILSLIAARKKGVEARENG